MKQCPYTLSHAILHKVSESESLDTKGLCQELCEGRRPIDLRFLTLRS